MNDKNTNRTIEYYNKYADRYSDVTRNADMSDIYKRFEEHLKPGSRILDLGCGSGRDSKYFLDKGYDVVSLDASEAMCRKTQELTGKGEQTRDDGRTFANYTETKVCDMVYSVSGAVLEDVWTSQDVRTDRTGQGHLWVNVLVKKTRVVITEKEFLNIFWNTRSLRRMFGSVLSMWISTRATSRHFQADT